MIKGSFNTMRSYSPEGQVIHYEYDPETGRCTFADVTRRVDGITALEPRIRHYGTVEYDLMCAYDAREYTTSRESLDFLNSLTGRL